MERSTIIKLRQKESTQVSTNGSFNTTLAEPILMKMGDVVKLHTAVLDTTTEALITVPADITVEMTTIKYVTNVELPTGGGLQMDYTIQPSGAEMPDLRRYYSGLAAPAGNDVFFLTTIRVIPEKKLKKIGFGNILKFEYEDPLTQKTRKWNFPLATVRESQMPKGYHDIPVTRFVQRQATMKNVNTQAELDDLNLTRFNLTQFIWGNGGLPLESGVLLLMPHEETLSFPLKASTYTPAEIGQIITDKMSLYNSLGAVGNKYVDATVPPSLSALRFPVNNPFLSTYARESNLVQQLPNSTSPVNADGSLGTPTTPNLYVLIPDVIAGSSQEEMVNVMTVTNPTSIGADRVIGASQTSLNFDTNLKKLNFDLLQTPFYIDPGNGERVPGVIYPPTGVTVPGGNPIVQEPQQAYGGIAFTQLSPPSFWQSLGFDGLLATVNPDNDVITLDNSAQAKSVKITALVGTQITGTFLGNDLIIDKGATYTTPAQGDVITSLTTPIVANRTFDQVSNDEGYYLIEVGMKMPQKLIGGQVNRGQGSFSTSSNKVQGIMGKYFTSGNFLQDTGSASITYTHIGEPQLVSELDVRITHADGSPPLVNELGEKNSIFMELISTIRPAVPDQMSENDFT